MHTTVVALLLLVGCLQLPAARLQFQVAADASLMISPGSGGDYQIGCSQAASGPSASVNCPDITYPGLGTSVTAGAFGEPIPHGFRIGAHASNFAGQIEVIEGDESIWISGDGFASASATFEGLFYMLGGSGIASFYLPELDLYPIDQITVYCEYAIDGVPYNCEAPFQARFGQPFHFEMSLSEEIYPNFQSVSHELTVDLSQLRSDGGLYEMRELPEPATVALAAPVLAILVLASKRRHGARLRVN